MPDELAPVADERGGKPSASGMERLILCPGSWQLEQAAGDEPESKDAAFGTRMHKYMEDGTLPENDEEREAVEWCRKKETYEAAEIFHKRNVGVQFPEPIRELRLWDKAQSFSGKVDVLYIYGDAAVIFDYKFGRTPATKATRNAQLAALALLVADNYPEVQVVYAGILQPYLDRWDVCLVEYGRAHDEFELVRARFKDAMAAARRENPKLKPGEAQCRYCKAASSCPAVALALRSVVLTQFDRWTQLTPEQRRDWYDMTRFAKKVIEKVEANIKEDMKAGLEIPGLSLTDGKKAFEVGSPAKAFAVLNRELGITGEEFTACCKVGISKLDKLVHGKRKEAGITPTVDASKAWLRELLTAEADGKTTLSEGSIKLNTK